MSTTTVNKENITDWLTDQICRLTKTKRETIHVNEPLSNYGLNSIQAVTLVGEIDDWLNVEFEPTLAWDYPTIESLANYIDQQVCQH